MLKVKRKLKYYKYYQSPTYRVWANMLSRCRNPKEKNFFNYGGRGIKVCNRWKSFDNFFEDMGVKPSGKSIDRKDNNGDYCKENCRWENNFNQSRNKRNNRWVKYKGKMYILTDLAIKLEVSTTTIKRRYGNGCNIDNFCLKKPGPKKKTINITGFKFSGNRLVDIKKLRISGLTLQQIADIYKLSRERIRKLLLK